MSPLSAPVFAAALAAVGLGAVAPASLLLARAHWVTRRPSVALILWQAVCLCAGLSLTGAALVFALEPLGNRLPAAMRVAFQDLFAGKAFRGLNGVRVAVLLAAVVFAIHLLVILILTIVRADLRRRRHRAVLDLICGPARGSAAAVRVLDEQAPLAWTVPGRRSRLVLTAGLMDLLTDRQLLAVLAHERTHLSVRHDVLLIPFQAWATAVPVPGMRAARASVRMLVEMQADDVAAESVGPATVASAIAAVVLAESGGSSPDSGAAPPGVVPPGVVPLGVVPLGASVAWGGRADSAVAARVRRLQQPRPLPLWCSLLVLLGSGALLAVPALVLFVGWR